MKPLTDSQSLSLINSLVVGVTAVFNVAHQYRTHTPVKLYPYFSD